MNITVRTNGRWAYVQDGEVTVALMEKSQWTGEYRAYVNAWYDEEDGTTRWTGPSVPTYRKSASAAAKVAAAAAREEGGRVMNKGKLALNLLDAAVHEGGGTFYADGDEFPRTGFIVGGKVPTLTIPAFGKYGPETVVFVMRWIGRNPSRFYGSWLHDGAAYIDAVDVFDDREQAIEVGKLRGEIAIYDMAAGADIRLDELQPAWFGGTTNEEGEVYGG